MQIRRSIWLRALHAEHAEGLADAEFQDPKGGARYALIDDPDLRQALGPLLGRIAHSHWWPVSRLGSEFCTPVGALPDCPVDWTIDPLKIAVLLRTADAARPYEIGTWLGLSRDDWRVTVLRRRPPVSGNSR